jgi:hypothetical protein
MAVTRREDFARSSTKQDVGDDDDSTMALQLSSFCTVSTVWMVPPNVDQNHLVELFQNVSGA